MTNHGDYSPQARTAAERKVRAAGVFADHAEVIVAALPDVPDNHVLVAIAQPVPSSSVTRSTMSSVAT